MTDITLIKKLNVLVPHWLEHNEEHIAEMQRYLDALEAEGQSVLAKGCSDILTEMNRVSDALVTMTNLLEPATQQR